MAKTASRRSVGSERGETPDYAAIGEMLRDTRYGYGLKVEQVALALHVKPSVVMAMEKGRLEEIPGGLIYAKGHLRNYAQHLGIDLASMLDPLTTTAAVKPIASVSSAHNEPRRTQAAAMLSLLAMLAAVGMWYGLPVERQEPTVSLVKPVPEELSDYLDAAESEGLSSPCIKDAAHPGWPPCYGEQERKELLRLQVQPLVSVMQVR